MARNKALQTNINNSDPVNYPDGRIKDNTGLGDGTPVDETVYGDIHEFFAKAMRLYGISYNDLPDNETVGYQYIDAVRAIASKNDFILNITTSSDKLRVPIKLGKMLDSEQVVCKAIIDKTTETTIVGSDNLEITVSFIGDFKANEYVRLIKTAASVVLVRMVDAVNLDAAVNELSFLKAATLTQELAGTSDAVATTPLTNLLAFVERVNGTTSDGALAIASVRNGLMSKEDKFILDNVVDFTSRFEIVNGNAQVTAPSGGDQSNNFNFNYVDVFPPTGYTMDDFVAITPSIRFLDFAGDVNFDDVVWCKWENQTTKIRIIAGCSEYTTPTQVQWTAFWIKTA